MLNDQPDPQVESAGDRVRFPPPLAFIGALLLGFALHLIFPLPLTRSLKSEHLLSLGGGVLVAMAAVLVVSAAICFRLARTSPGFHRPSSALITSGPFRFSRNPVYLAGALLHCGLPLLANALWPLVLLPPALVVVNALIRREESYLAQRFGSDYEAYRRRVRRWI